MTVILFDIAKQGSCTKQAKKLTRRYRGSNDDAMDVFFVRDYQYKNKAGFCNIPGCNKDLYVVNGCVVVNASPPTRIILDSQSDAGPRVPLALSGKVFCKVDADATPVAIGDLLTTSDIAGHARKVTDPLASFGAVLGKAMGPLDEGQGLIPILVCLA